MLDGVLLIVVLMFAVFGLYCAAELILRAVSRRKDAAERVVILKAEKDFDVWEDVLDTRLQLPDVPIVVLCSKKAPLTPPDAGWRGVVFAEDDTLSSAVRDMMNPQRFRCGKRQGRE